MPLPGIVKKSLSAFRAVAGEGTEVERWVKSRYLRHVDNQLRKEKGRGWVQWSGRRFIVISENEDLPGPRRGVVLRGGCDLPSIYTAAPLIREGIRGTVALAKVSSGGAGGHRTDQILQSLQDLPPELTSETSTHLKLGADYFRPILFKREFEVPKHPEFGKFPQSVVAMSIASDLTRTLYRHRKHGYLVDPGGWWLNQSLDKVLTDLSTVEWFRSTFKAVGKISIEDFSTNMGLIVEELAERAGSAAIVYNSLVVDPANGTHNYQLVKGAHSTRRREFVIALAELSAAKRFHVVDVDRILKTEGVEAQVDFAHFPVERTAPIGAEVHRILTELAVV